MSEEDEKVIEALRNRVAEETLQNFKLLPKLLVFFLVLPALVLIEAINKLRKKEEKLEK